MREDTTLLELQDISKVFPGVKALDNVCLKVKKGEILALIGENGAGKSTLMKIVLGSYQRDGGKMYFKGKAYDPKSPSDALTHGISMIHQEISLVPTMTVSENIWMGREEQFAKSVLISRSEMTAATEKLLKELEINLNPDKQVGDLSIANMQLVEIARAVSYHADVIIMDEPTSSLTNKEVDILYRIIRKLSAEGTGIIFISHKLDELFEICDTVTVLRDGRYIDTRDINKITKEELIRMMVGREVKDMFPKEDVEIGNVIFETKDLCRKGYFDSISFKVCSGEIVGFCGLVGAGRTEIMQCIFGTCSSDSGAVFLHGKQIENKSSQDAIRHKIGMITEDRLHSGILRHLSIKSNIALANLNRYTRGGMVNDKKLVEDAQRMADYMHVKMKDIDQEAGMLSGGNQQKVIIGKWLLTEPDLLILDEPTRGIDVGSKAEIYRIIGTLAKQGKGIIIVSSELPELMGICDRIIVVSKGKITGELPRKNFSQEKLMSYAFQLEGTQSQEAHDYEN